MLGYINRVRRTITKGLTKSIAKSHINKKQGTHVTMRRILLSRPNHRLGNLLLITPLLQEISSTFPDCKVDLFVKGNLAPILFKNYSNVDKIITLPKKPFKELFKYMKVWVSLKKHRYDMVINLDYDSSSGRLSTRFVTATNKIYGEHIEELAAGYDDYGHMAKNPVYKFRYYLSLLGFKYNNAPIPPLDIKLSVAERAEGKKILNGLVPRDKKTICIFTNATGPKCYNEKWWGSYYKKMKKAFPDYNIVEILPVENISKIGFKAPSFYSKDVREMAGVIANAVAFVGADSGVMHLAAATTTPVVGLFSVTNPVKYMPYGNGNIAINTNKCTIDKNLAILRSIIESRQQSSAATVQYA